MPEDAGHDKIKSALKFGLEPAAVIQQSTTIPRQNAAKPAVAP